MASPAPRQPDQDGGESREVLDILRRLEPVLSGIQAEQRRQGEVQRLQGEIQRQQSEIQRQQGESIARLDGRVTQLPTNWQMLTAIVAILGAAFAFMRLGH